MSKRKIFKETSSGTKPKAGFFSEFRNENGSVVYKNGAINESESLKKARMLLNKALKRTI